MDASEYLVDAQVEFGPRPPRERWFKVEMWVKGIDPFGVEDTEHDPVARARSIVAQLPTATILVDGLKVTAARTT